ncbi:hypothetical protein [Thermofilum pendens]|uniref:Uncharacterized protein n=1 Tax=Thermofilum pendens (strain DSM 2475 / Hrk 5) TaxID=368408 RepID=A1RYA2_THEPD|nr:hypothetical protein [Thermofilum pendens]ABL78182.1 conserved hypothetical protein [Thermofilum pendens Hrk 5]
MKVSLTYTYIHAEKLSEPTGAQINVNVQLTFPTSMNIVGGELVAEFLANVTSVPAFFTVSLKGRISVSASEGELKELQEGLKNGRPDPQIIQMLSSNVLFETMLLLRELGIPPSLPLPPPPQPQRSEDGRHYFA